MNKGLGPSSLGDFHTPKLFKIGSIESNIRVTLQVFIPPFDTNNTKTLK